MTGSKPVESSALIRLVASIEARLHRTPVVVGVDLRGNSARPTGLAICRGAEVHTSVVRTDGEIVEGVFSARPDIVSIDAPLSLPRGVRTIPRPRATGVRCPGRECERVLWSRGIRAYSPLIPSMRMLTRRGIALAARLRSHGFAVIESFPGAAQDILSIARKRQGVAQLQRGLARLGLVLRSGTTHDELDAVTSALVGLFYLAGEHEALGAPEEGCIVVPRASRHLTARSSRG